MSINQPVLKSLKELLQGRKFAIDEYQREYKWEEKNITELLDDLYTKFLVSHRPENPTEAVANYESYFLGSVIVSQRAGRNYLVDGQQRTTSLTLLLIFLHHLQNKLRAEGVLPNSVNLTLLIYSDNFGANSYNLDIPERRPVLEAIFNEKEFDPTNQDESIQTMFARYKDIEQEFPEPLRKGEGLLHFVYWLLNRVFVIEITATTDEDAYAIFETMNDRGKPLSPTDMIKAYLLAQIADTNERAAVNRLWKQRIQQLTTISKEEDADFIKAWLRAKYADSIRERQAGAKNQDWERIGNEFHKWVRDNRKLIGLNDAASFERFLRDIFIKYSNIYERIRHASLEFTEGLETVYYNAQNDFTLQYTVLLAPLSDGDDQETILRKIRVTASFLDILLIRRIVNYIRISYSANYYAMFLLLKEIRNKPLYELVEILEKRLNEEEATFDSARGGERRGIDEFGLNNFSKRYIHHILARMTAHIETQSGRENRFAEYVRRNTKNPYEIEHIWANHYSRFNTQFASEKEFDDARNNLGGLLLLPADFNRSFQDKTYEEKLPHYNAQNLLARSLSLACYINNPQFLEYVKCSNLPFQPYEHFSRQEQKERRKLYRAIAEEIWNPARLRKDAGL
ncbi:MAG TPA: DUF262 domain-containing protein [Pyrinomonadaceae bacterium]|jgi:uncharacterized protein with ParB-like and HNH nuclease domain